MNRMHTNTIQMYHVHIEHTWEHISLTLFDQIHWRMYIFQTKQKPKSTQRKWLWPFAVFAYIISLPCEYKVCLNAHRTHNQSYISMFHLVILLRLQLPFSRCKCPYSICNYIIRVSYILFTPKYNWMGWKRISAHFLGRFYQCTMFYIYIFFITKRVNTNTQ